MKQAWQVAEEWARAKPRDPHPKQPDKTGCAYCGHRATNRLYGVLVCPFHRDLPRLEVEAGTLEPPRPKVSA